MKTLTEKNRKLSLAKKTIIRLNISGQFNLNGGSALPVTTLLPISAGATNCTGTTGSVQQQERQL